MGTLTPSFFHSIVEENKNKLTICKIQKSGNSSVVEGCDTDNMIVSFFKDLLVSPFVFVLGMTFYCIFPSSFKIMSMPTLLNPLLILKLESLFSNLINSVAGTDCYNGLFFHTY